MKANELRIGNLLNGKNGHVIVKSIDVKGFVRIEDNSSFFNVQGDFPCLEPIPLTEEWLLRFGFEEIEIDQIWYFIKDRFIFEHSGVIGFYEFGEIQAVCIQENKCKHVHQLQNLYFALTGEELNLNQ